jgi:alpha-1,6-mannosyltransferase
MSFGRWRAALLIALGAIMLLLTGAGLLLQHENARGGFILVELAQAAVYLLAVGLTWRGGFSRRALMALLGLAVVLRLCVLFAPPYLSDDINRYVWDGRVEAAGINPYRYIPVDPHLAALWDDKIFPNVNRSTYAPTIYPPVAEYIFFAATRASESLTWMKATMLAFELTTIVLLLRLLALFELPRERILVYAWHPLLLWEFAGSGHIDAAVATFVTLALWARQHKADWLAGVAVAAAGLVKFFPAVIFPALYRRWDWKMPAVAAASVILAYLPFLAVGRAVLGFLPGYVNEEGLRNGSGFFLWNLLKSAAPQISDIGVLPYLAFAAAAIGSLAAYVVLSDKAAKHYIGSATALAVATTILVSPHYPWYFAWLVPFLCFAPYPSVLYLTVASPLLYFVPGGPDPQGHRMIVDWAIYGPFTALAAIELRLRRAGASFIKVEA